jgi:hypothetical protein
MSDIEWELSVFKRLAEREGLDFESVVKQAQTIVSNTPVESADSEDNKESSWAKKLYLWWERSHERI